MDLDIILKYTVLFFAGVFAAGALAYVVIYCAVRGAFAAFIRSIFEQNKPTNKDKERKGE